MATTRCDALKANGHPCRGYGTPTGRGVALCHMHTAFYDSVEPAWKNLRRNSSIFQSTEERGWHERMLRAPPLQTTEHKKALMAKLEELYKSGSWHAKDIADYIYMTALRAGFYRPTDSTALWARGVHRNLRVLQFCAAQPTAGELAAPALYRGQIVELLRPYLTGARAGYAIPFLLNTMRHPNFDVNNQIPMDISGTMWREVTDYAFGAMDMRVFAFRPLSAVLDPIVAHHAATYPHSRLLDPGLQAHVRQLFERLQAAERAKIRERISPFKEDLMIAAWSSERVARALEAGMEMEDL